MLYEETNNCVWYQTILNDIDIIKNNDTTKQVEFGLVKQLMDYGKIK